MYIYKIQKHFQNVMLVGMAGETSKNYTYKCVDHSRHNRRLRLTASLELRVRASTGTALVYQEEWRIAETAFVHHKKLPLYQLEGVSTVHRDSQLITPE